MWFLAKIGRTWDSDHLHRCWLFSWYLFWRCLIPLFSCSYFYNNKAGPDEITLCCAVLSCLLASNSAISWTAALQAPQSMGILQARTLQGGAIPFSRGSSPPRDWTHISCIAGRFFPTEPPGKSSITHNQPDWVRKTFVGKNCLYQSMSEQVSDKY